MTSPDMLPVVSVHGAKMLTLTAGQCGRISRMDAESEEILRLKSMGVCVGRKVQILRSGDPLILMVLGTRIGLSARLAEHVWVNCCESFSD